MATGSAVSAQAGMVYLTSYSLGLALPFLASTIFLNVMTQNSRKLGRWSAYTRPVAGTIVIVMGIAIATGTMTQLSSFMLGLFPSLATLG